MQWPSVLGTIAVLFIGVSNAELHVNIGSTTHKYKVGKDISSDSLARQILTYPPTAIVRFEHLTAEEASKLPAPVCRRIGLDCWCDCYRNLGDKDYLMNHFSSACVREIPAELIAGLRPEDVPKLGVSFLRRMNPAQLAAMKPETRLAFSDIQLVALIESDMSGLIEKGEMCRSLHRQDLIKIENDRPEVIKALSPECISVLGKNLRYLGPKITSKPHLFNRLPLADIVYLPNNRTKEELILGLFDNGSVNCKDLTSKAISMIPEHKISSLGRDCWKVATTGERFKRFTLTTRIVQKLPSSAWTAVGAKFFKNLKVSGSIRGNEIRELLSSVGKGNPDACNQVLGLINAFTDPSIVAHLSTTCLLKLTSEDIKKIEDSKIFNNIPTEVIKSFTPSQISAIQPRIFSQLSESFIKALTQSTKKGCSGLKASQLTFLGEKADKLSLLSLGCMEQISVRKITELSPGLIPKFNDKAFSFLNRVDFDVIEGRKVGNLLKAMRTEQISALGDAHMDELHLCQDLHLDISDVMRGIIGGQNLEKRKITLGPILANTCLPAVKPTSFSTLDSADIHHFGHLLFRNIKNPLALSNVPAEVFTKISQKQLDNIKPITCSGLQAEQLGNLPKNVKINNLECLKNLHPEIMATLYRSHRNLLPGDVSSILTLEVMEHLKDSELQESDYVHLGTRVPEVMNPCRAISAVSLPVKFLKTVDGYCLAALPDLDKVPFEKVRPFIGELNLSLLSKESLQKLRDASWKVEK